jgi:hypothetical protein
MAEELFGPKRANSDLEEIYTDIIMRSIIMSKIGCFESKSSFNSNITIALHDFSK